MRVSINPKILAGGLIGLALILIWYNMRSDDDTPASSSASVRHDTAAPSNPIHPAAIVRSRRGQLSNDRGGLRLRPIDPTRGDVDPTLRLDLLARLQNVALGAPTRSLFEAAPPPLTPEQQAILRNPPKIPKAPVPPIPPGPVTPTEQPVNIPLKYYGFVKSAEKNQGNAGLFLDGDNVVVGSEGELVMKRYLVVALTPTSARLEDTQVKKGQTLQVVPAATP